MVDVDYSHKNAFYKYGIIGSVDPSKLSGITGIEAMRRLEAHEEDKRQELLKDPKKSDRHITLTPEYSYGKDGKEYMSIRINTHEDDTHYIRFSPGMSDHDWKIEFDLKTHTYSCTSGTWLETMKRNGSVPLWKRGEDI